MRRFEFVEGTSKKFWEIDLAGKSFEVRWGRIGTDGQTKKKKFSSTAMAEAEAATLVQQKLKKGYVEIGGKRPRTQKLSELTASPAPYQPPTVSARSDWERLRKRIKILGAGSAKSRPKDKVLAAHEARTGFALPSSYKAYCQTFGGGEFCGYFDVFVPGGSLERFQQEWTSSYREIWAASHGKVCDRLIVFGTTVAGDIMGWDPDDRARGLPVEYAVVILSRSSDRAVRVARTFRECVENVFLKPRRLPKLLGYVDDGDEPLPIDFAPS
ncbi:MAG TPA: WGR domain-containing protein [Planctomycetota bacterium]|nr:WGR domain-containing protein [Planctomycetota bacterium]